MKKAIFVSYRRGDSAGYTGWLCEKLLYRWSREQIFFDIDGIGLGENFRTKITAAVQSCDVLIPVIGRSWLTTVDDKGKLRLGRSNDVVTIEISAALQRDIFVIPVLVDGASMPDEEDLPDPLKQLASINALNLRHESFGRDVEMLIKAVENRFAVTEGGTALSVETLPPMPQPSPAPLDSLAKIRKRLPPATFANDPQRGRFGGRFADNERTLRASVRPTGRDKWCAVTITVRPDNAAAPLIGENVFFFVHDSFEPDEFTVRVNGDGDAVLQLVAWGAFTVGAVADNGETLLELDLADPQLVDAPSDWQAR